MVALFLLYPIFTFSTIYLKLISSENSFCPATLAATRPTAYRQGGW